MREPSGPSHQHADRSALTGLLTYTYNYTTPQPYGFNSIIHPAWSLAVEEQFYLLWPITLTWLGSGKARRALLIGFAGVIVWRFVASVLLHLPQTYLDWAFEANAGTLALGCWLALYTKQTDKLWWLRLARPRWLTIWLGVVFPNITALWCTPDFRSFAFQQFGFVEEQLYQKWLPVFHYALDCADEARSLMKRLAIL